MKSTERQLASRRSGTLLSPDEIDVAKATGNHRRSEALKDTINGVKIVAVCIAALAIPLLYIVILWANWSDPAARNEWLRQGLVGVIAFALGRVDFGFGDKKD